MRLIDADALLEKVWDADTRAGYVQVVDRGDIEEAPTIEPERKTGEWIRNDNGTYSCSLCQSWIPEEQYYYARFCLYCGAYNER